MVNCDTTGLNSGASGAGVTWNFSGLVASGGYSTTTVEADTSSVYLTSNLLEILPNGQQEYVQENSSASMVNGLYDPSTGNTATYNNFDIAQRPMAYTTNYVDSYSVTIPGPPFTKGIGAMRETGDAYGTLVLPSGNYSNVLRVKKVQNETDTIEGSSPYVVSSSTISYLWFDGVHPAPLLRIDSVSNPAVQSWTIMYLASLESVSTLTQDIISCNAWFADNALLLTGNFVSSKNYEVIVYNMIGVKIFTSSFIGNNNRQQFDINRQVPPGIYIVSVENVNDPSSRQIMKVLKH